MDRRLYRELYELEDVHWWFRGRRRIIESFLCRLPPKLHRAVDIGCGTGRNVQVLKHYASEVEAVEDSKEALALAKQRIPDLKIIDASFQDFNFGGRPYDLITLFDVLEHMPEDGRALAKVESLLAPGGFAMLTVPALPVLWTAHDELAHHKRRYTKRNLETLIQQHTALRILRLSYFNTFLFPLIFMVRMLRRALRLKSGSSDFFMLPRPLNSFLTWLFSLEARLLPVFNLPIGVSLICLLQKTA